MGENSDLPNHTWDSIAQAHVDSFNYMVDCGLQEVASALKCRQFELPVDASTSRIGIKISKISIGRPMTSAVDPVLASSSSRRSSLLGAMANANAGPMYPRECRERAMNYEGQLSVTISMQFNGLVINSSERNLGQIPIMVRSKMCHLHGLSVKDLVRRKEESVEFGGYFIIGGHERIIRLLQVQKRNYALAISRSKWKSLGDFYSEFGIIIRSYDGCHTAQLMTLHYLTSGIVQVAVKVGEATYYVPLMVMLKGLIDVSDKFIYEEMLRGHEHDYLLRGSIINMQHRVNDSKLFSRGDIISYLGKTFRVVMNSPPWYSDSQIGEDFLADTVCIHLKDSGDKFNFLVNATQKLFALVQGQCTADSPDNPMCQEVLLPGHLLLMVLRERLDRFTYHLRRELEKRAEKRLTSTELPQVFTKCIQSCASGVSRTFTYLLATGNLLGVGSLCLQQSTGLSVVAEKINFMRFISHFRAIHRGAFFMTMRTTDVRKLRPEAWGFICPVHTPDGSPCGLLNHLAAICRVVCYHPTAGEQILLENVVKECLANYGFLDSNSTNIAAAIGPRVYTYPVLCDGRLLGRVPLAKAPDAVAALRRVKVAQRVDAVPGHSLRFLATAEIVLVPWRDPKKLGATIYPGIYIFSHGARLIRPVRNLIAGGATEWIGVYEQVFMQICITPEEAEATEGTPYPTTHQELVPNAMLSTLATLTPFSDHNQSPRNIYQCQMGKQTLGHPGVTLKYRGDNKMYNLQTPQRPLVKTRDYDRYKIDDVALGTNAIVAVISYTGYDMEDAMVINKSSYERGFAHAQVYKTAYYDLTAESKTRLFGRDPNKPELVKFLDMDGLPYQGIYLSNPDAPLYCYFDTQTNKYEVVKFKSSESAYVDHVKILPPKGGKRGGEVSGLTGIRSIAISLRFPRNPSIGDKFASRHGQKGICSFLWPTENMPFTDTGMVPDIIFNPHGFPSRMTIGQMIELMAGKAAMSHGTTLDATPFTFSEDNPAYKYYGDLLVKAGYNYLGNEQMYSGIDGREFEVGIFFGVIYYQRLRHMVADKYQIRTTGPVDPLTHQPIHGRKYGGGVRFGEMERDSLISHGASFLLQDRLLNCSDRDVAYVCASCGDLLSPCWMSNKDIRAITGPSGVNNFGRRYVCRLCGSQDKVKLVKIPYVLRYLTNELVSMNMRIKFDVRQIE